MRRPLALLGAHVLLVAGLLVDTSPAYAAVAGTVSLVDGQVFYLASPGQANRVVVTGGDGLVHVTDVVPMLAGPGCTQQVKTTVDCAGYMYWVNIHSGDLDDSIRIDATAVVHYLIGGLGNDTLTAGPASRSKIMGERGADVLIGGPGADLLIGGSDEPDVMSGGPGIDLVSYFDIVEPVWADLDGRPDDGNRGEGDTIMADVENLEGGQSSDFLVGNDNANRIWGVLGEDWIYGFGGADDLTAGGAGSAQRGSWIFGGTGNDRITGDGAADNLYGEEGNDTLFGNAGYDHIEGNAGVNTCFPGADGAELIGCQHVPPLR